MVHTGWPIKTVGTVAVATAGTAVQLTTNAAHRNLHAVFIQADDGNSTDMIFVGDADVSATNYIRKLAVDESFDIIGDLNGLGNIDATSIWIDASANTTDVQWGFI